MKRKKTSAQPQLDQNSDILIKTFAEMVSILIDADQNKDGKWNLVEIWRILKMILGKGSRITKNWKLAIHEIKNFTPQQKRALVAKFRDDFKIKNSETEILIEEWLETLLKISELVDQTRKKAKINRIKK